MTSTNQELFSDVIRALSLVLDLDEGRKLNHAWRVGVISHKIGRVMGYPRCDLLFNAGLLHDVGSVGLRDHVIHHAVKGFGDSEAREHSSRGAAILRPFAPLAPVAGFIQDHHEHFDGTGFPAGKKGEDVPVEASIIQMGDLMDVLLRGLPSEERPQRVFQLIGGQNGKTVSPEVAQAAAALVRKEPEVVNALFDPRDLKNMVYEIEAVPPEVDDFSRLDLLGQLLWLFARTIDAKSPMLMGHSVRVAYYAHKIAQAVGEDDINPWDVLWCGLLHDVGSLGVSRKVLEQSAKSEDFQAHARYTVEIISNIRDLAYLAFAAGAHHEQYDGNGYPNGSRGEGIPLMGRILAFADTYDWLSTAPGASHHEAMAEIRKQVGTRFDPRIAPVALNVLDSCGAGNLPLPEDAEAFQRLFMTDVADVASLVPGKRQSALTSEGRGIILGKAEEWVRVSLSENLDVLSGREEVRELMGQDIPRLSHMVEDGAQAAALLEALEASGNQMISGNVVTPLGVHVEVLLIPRDYGWDALLKRKSGASHPLKRMSVLYQSFLSSSEAIAFTDGEGFITDANKALLDLYGHSLEELIGRQPAILGIHEQTHVYDEINEELANRTGGNWVGELVQQKKDGSEVVALVTVNSLADSTGNIMGHIWHMADITERRNLEKRLEEQNIHLKSLNRLKSDLMAVTSHDLKSPLNVIAGYAGLIKETAGVLNPDSLNKYLDNIIESVHRMVKFIGLVLDAQKIESGKLELDLAPCNLSAVLENHVQDIGVGVKTNGQKLRHLEQGVSREILVDQGRMEQVFDNLISNAAKFSPEGSTITVEYVDKGEDLLEISVSDEGPGIPEEDLAKIFDRYFQVKKHGETASERSFGSGLGLYISRQIMKMHGGDIHAENRPEGGCRFVITLPASPPGERE